MFFSAYWGEERHRPTWEALFQKHAEWLRLTPSVCARRLPSGKVFAWGRLSQGERKTEEESNLVGEEWLLSSSERAPGARCLSSASIPQLMKALEVNEICLVVSIKRERLRIIVPPATAEQLHFTSDGRDWVFSNDFRFLLRWREQDRNWELDKRAVYALFQYGAIPPPLTLARGIQRVPGGHVLEVPMDPNSHGARLEAFFQPGRVTVSIEGEPEEPEARVVWTLDRLLATVPEGTAVYFSGGIDSTLLALRLAAMGRTDTRLIHYSFGPRDEETRVALKIAERLGLRCEIVLYDPSQVSSMLGRIGRDYSYPFGDYSSVVTNLLVHDSTDLVGDARTVVDGIGADGAFGLGLKYPLWRRVYALPRWSRSLLGRGYERLALWKRDGEVEWLGRIFRRSAQMPLLHAGVAAQNALDGIVYVTPTDIREELTEILTSYTEVLAEGLEPQERFALLDLVHVCAGQFAAKSFDPLRLRGIKPLFPFLEPPMIRLSTSLPWEVKCQDQQPKALLKKILARHLPRELIYRPKSAFIPPIREIMKYEDVQSFLREIVLSQRNPLLDFVQIEPLRGVIQSAQRGQLLSVGVYNFLWVLLFTSGWLDQVRSQLSFARG